LLHCLLHAPAPAHCLGPISSPLWGNIREDISAAAFCNRADLTCPGRQAHRRFREYEEVRKKMSEHAEAISPPRKIAPILEVDYMALVAANVHRERNSMVPMIC
jgi:hypothetical protein